MFGNIDMQISW